MKQDTLTLVASVLCCSVESLRFESCYMRIDIKYPGFKGTIFVQVGKASHEVH